ncbi:hypothetical protein VITFI_CDS0260 [Vitreoscilla filiformis]|uniref:Uncharacterized protein n=1 Tax=Vitreoscilla filiformis TaxID=63 RepID=A0A221KAN4_VITFI|nr:hypothetical protein VITFI_CDS0260 [Vitreoscilla filiformis]
MTKLTSTQPWLPTRTGKSDWKASFKDHQRKFSALSTFVVMIYVTWENGFMVQVKID